MAQLTVTPASSAFMFIWRPRPKGMMRMGFEAVCAAIDRSEYARAFWLDRRPLVMFGVSPELANRGTFWMLFDVNIDAQPATLALREGRRYFNELPHDQLRAWIDPAVDRDKRFAEWFGFQYDCTATAMAPDGSDLELWFCDRGKR